MPEQGLTFRCARVTCTTTLELPLRTTMWNMRRMIRLAGWCWRGTRNGYAYYCAAHHPPQF